jgi:hypothetical protein
VLEHQRSHGGRPGLDPHRLPAKQEERRPDQVQPLGGQECGAERKRGRNALGRETHAEVADEHASPLSPIQEIVLPPMAWWIGSSLISAWMAAFGQKQP